MTARVVPRVLLVLLSIAAVATGYTIWQIKADVDRATARLTLDPGPVSTVIFDAKDRPISALYREHRLPVSLEEMSDDLVQAVLVTEDRRFFEHDGIDRRRILASMVTNLREGRITQGASTISQQLARATGLDRSRTYSRKLREVWLAQRLEEKYGKKAILQAYLNHVYLGDGYYGVEAASLGYFAKPAAKLRAAESATLAALISRPSGYTLRRTPARIRDRRDWVLRQMFEARYLDPAEFGSAIATPVNLTLASAAQRASVDPAAVTQGPYFVSLVTEQLYNQYGVTKTLTGGLRVYTTLDTEVQQFAEAAVAKRLTELDKQSTAGEPLQAALVAMETTTGYVRAIVG
ncbi:MAG: transglycosylase domain-containing protein, partial [Acidobacteriota bacterium]|nr:transglycosylase domain-containing protein [Acidobacteriota bacterium]